MCIRDRDHCAAETRLVVDGFVRCLLPGTRRTQGFCLCAELDGVLLRGIVLPLSLIHI